MKNEWFVNIWNISLPFLETFWLLTVVNDQLTLFSSNCWFWPHTTRREDVVDGDEVGRLHHHRHNQEVQEVGAVRQVSWTLADHEKEKKPRIWCLEVEDSHQQRDLLEVSRAAVEKEGAENNTKNPLLFRKAVAVL